MIGEDEHRKFQRYIKGILDYYNFITQVEYELIGKDGQKHRVDVVGVRRDKSDTLGIESLKGAGIGIEVVLSGDVYDDARKLTMLDFRWRMVVIKEQGEGEVLIEGVKIPVVKLENFQDRLIELLGEVQTRTTLFSGTKDDSLNIGKINGYLRDAGINPEEFFEVLVKIYAEKGTYKFKVWKGEFYTWSGEHVGHEEIKRPVVSALQAFGLLDEYGGCLTEKGLSLAKLKLVERIKEKRDLLIEKLRSYPPVVVMTLALAGRLSNSGHVYLLITNESALSFSRRHEIELKLKFILSTALANVSAMAKAFGVRPSLFTFCASMYKHERIVNAEVGLMQDLERLGLAVHRPYISSNDSYAGEEYYAPPEVGEALLEYSRTLKVDEQVIKRFGMLSIVYNVMSFKDPGKARDAFKRASEAYGVNEEEFAKFIEELKSKGLTGPYIKDESISPFIILNEDGLLNYLNDEVDKTVECMLGKG